MQLLESIDITEYRTSVDTRDQCYSFVKACDMTLCDPIEDLTVSLLVAYVSDTRLSSDIRDCSDESWCIILAHVCPCEVPVLKTR